MTARWNEHVSSLAGALLEERKFNKRVKLPKPNDVLMLSNHTKIALSKLDLTLVTMDNYRGVVRLTQSRLVTYNKRRPGEIDGIR